VASVVALLLVVVVLVVLVVVLVRALVRALSLALVLAAAAHQQRARALSAARSTCGPQRRRAVRAVLPVGDDAQLLGPGFSPGYNPGSALHR
jgi:hypothetical protein